MSATSSEQQKDEPESEEEVDHRCGYFRWRPQCLQRFNTPPWLLVCLMWFTFNQGFVVNGIVNVNLSSLERRFELSSGQVAWLSSSYDLVAAILALVFGYLGTFVHKSRVIAIGAFILSCGSFTMVLPHILAGNYEAGAKGTEVCDIYGNSTDCSAVESSSNYLAFFIFGQLLHAVGGAAIYTLSVPLLDETVKRKDSAFYIGCVLSCSVLGPGMGFIVGGIFLQFYVDVGRVDTDDITITPQDPRWVGAWWMGFIYSGFAALTGALLAACFPREMPSAKKFKSGHKSEAYGGIGEEQAAKRGFGQKPEHIIASLKIILRNPTFILVTIAGTMEYSLVIGFAAFLPKIIQFQFAQSPTMAAVWAGAIVVPAATCGHILGGLIPKWMNLKIKGLMVQALIFNGIAWILMFQSLLKCDIPKIAGISVPYENSTLDIGVDNPDVANSCNANCSCSTISYDPVCGQNGVTYFTPCHAGCLQNDDSEDNEVFFNCSCVEYESEIDPIYPDAESGLCDTDCSVFPAFLVLFFLLNLSTFIPLTAGQATTMRIVPHKQRAFAFGIQSTFVRLLGNVPGPLLFGAIFDSSCWLWQETCEGQGSCWIYNPDNVAQGILILGLVFKGISFLGSLAALFLYKPPPPKVQETELQTDMEAKTEAFKPNKSMGQYSNGGFTHELDEKNINEITQL